MSYTIQMSEQDVKDVLAKHFDTKPEDIKIQHRTRYVGYIGQGTQTEMVPYVVIEVKKQIQE